MQQQNMLAGSLSHAVQGFLNSYLAGEILQCVQGHASEAGCTGL